MLCVCVVLCVCCVVCALCCVCFVLCVCMWVLCVCCVCVVLCCVVCVLCCVYVLCCVCECVCAYLHCSISHLTCAPTSVGEHFIQSLFIIKQRKAHMSRPNAERTITVLKDIKQLQLRTNAHKWRAHLDCLSYLIYHTYANTHTHKQTNTLTFMHIHLSTNNLYIHWWIIRISLCGQTHTCKFPPKKGTLLSN